MRSLPLTTACLILSAVAVGSAIHAQGTAPANPPKPAKPAAAAPAPQPAPAPANSGDAAARHAKRTACIADAKAKKLIGDQRTEYIKNCTAAP